MILRNVQVSGAGNAADKPVLRDVEVYPLGAVVHCYGHARPDNAHLPEDHDALQRGGILTDQISIGIGVAGVLRRGGQLCRRGWVFQICAAYKDSKSGQGDEGCRIIFHRASLFHSVHLRAFADSGTDRGL